MLVLSSRFACATASMTSTVSFGHGPRSSTVIATSGRFLLGVALLHAVIQSLDSLSSRVANLLLFAGIYPADSRLWHTSFYADLLLSQAKT